MAEVHINPKLPANFVGLAVRFRNPLLGYDWYGSPHEILESIKRVKTTPKEAAEHPQTEIKGSTSHRSGSAFKIRGGPHAQGIMKLVELFVKPPKFDLALKVLEEDPEVLTGNYDGAEVPLTVYTSLGRADVVEFLLKQNAQVNRRGQYGMTALHWAAVHGQTEIARMLLAAGADPLLESWFLLKPIHLANSNRHVELTQLLAERSAGARADFGSPADIFAAMGMSKP